MNDALPPIPTHRICIRRNGVFECEITHRSECLNEEHIYNMVRDALSNIPLYKPTTISITIEELPCAPSPLTK